MEPYFYMPVLNIKDSRGQKLCFLNTSYLSYITPVQYKSKIIMYEFRNHTCFRLKILPETKEKMKHCFNQYVCKVASGDVFLNPLDPTDLPSHMRYFPRISPKFPQDFQKQIEQLPKFKALHTTNYLSKRNSVSCIW